MIVDLAARKRSGTIAVGASPEGVGLSPDGRWVAAAVEETNEIVFVDTRTNAKSFVVKVRGKNPEHAVFTPDGRYVFVSAEDGEAVDIIDVAKRAQVGQVPVGARPRGIAFSADSKRAYVAAENSNEVFVIDAQAFTVLAKIKAGLRSNGVALHPDGKWLYVSNGGDATVSVIDLATNSAVATVAGRPAAVEHGAHARRQEALRRLRALGQRLGDRHAQEREDRGHRRRQAAMGRRHPLVEHCCVASVEST